MRSKIGNANCITFVSMAILLFSCNERSHEIKSQISTSMNTGYIDTRTFAFVYKENADSIKLIYRNDTLSKYSFSYKGHAITDTLIESKCGRVVERLPRYTELESGFNITLVSNGEACRYVCATMGNTGFCKIYVDSFIDEQMFKRQLHLISKKSLKEVYHNILECELEKVKGAYIDTDIANTNNLDVAYVVMNIKKGDTLQIQQRYTSSKYKVSGDTTNVFVPEVSNLFQCLFEYDLIVQSINR